MSIGKNMEFFFFTENFPSCLNNNQIDNLLFRLYASTRPEVGSAPAIDAF